MEDRKHLDGGDCLIMPHYLVGPSWCTRQVEFPLMFDPKTKTKQSTAYGGKSEARWIISSDTMRSFTPKPWPSADWKLHTSLVTASQPRNYRPTVRPSPIILLSSLSAEPPPPITASRQMPQEQSVLGGSTDGGRRRSRLSFFPSTYVYMCIRYYLLLVCATIETSIRV